jgi:hypothetical protein
VSSSPGTRPVVARGHGRGDAGQAEPAPAMNLLAVHDPSRRDIPAGVTGRHPGYRGVTVAWVRPTDLASQVAAGLAARGVALHMSVHRRVTDQARAALRSGAANRRRRLAPVAAFGAHPGAAPAPGRPALHR